MESEDDPVLDTPPSFEEEVDLIDYIDLEALLDPSSHLNPNLLAIKNKSQTFPPSISASANLFLKQVSQEIENLPRRGQIPPNLSFNHRQALKKLKSYKHITIRKSDKGVM